MSIRPKDLICLEITKALITADPELLKPELEPVRLVAIREAIKIYNQVSSAADKLLPEYLLIQ